MWNFSNSAVSLKSPSRELRIIKLLISCAVNYFVSKAKLNTIGITSIFYKRIAYVPLAVNAVKRRRHDLPPFISNCKIIVNLYGTKQQLHVNLSSGISAVFPSNAFFSAYRKIVKIRILPCR